MAKISLLLCFVSALVLVSSYLELDDVEDRRVLVAVLVRNKEHTLPYFLTCLHRLDYNKDKMLLWIFSDYNIDKSDDVIEEWLSHYGDQYVKVNYTKNTAITGTGRGSALELSPQWTKEQILHVIYLREKALQYAREHHVSYLFMIDADVFLTNPDTLRSLTRKNLEVVAPLLNSDGLYSNFWGDMNDEYYYRRSDDYVSILQREVVGCFPVPMVHSCVLINLMVPEAKDITYDPSKLKNYDGPEDDIIAFAVNSKRLGLTLQVCNDRFYGFIQIPPNDRTDLSSERQQLTNLKVEAIGRGHQIPVNYYLRKFLPVPKLTTMDFDQVYLINLEKRPERRIQMEASLFEMGVDYTLFKAIDSSEITPQAMEDLDIKFMPKYADPYHGRPMKTGEIGCFLSHYFLWREVVEENYEQVMILEDDVRFMPDFVAKVEKLKDELQQVSFKWDLIYLGRKALENEHETYETKNTIRPKYSYWTIGYLLSNGGARKLLAAKPLQRLLPVDEFLPIMFNEHPNTTWKQHFKKRDLVALSAWPLLVYPTHYTGEAGYVSDTEDSAVVTHAPHDETAGNEINLEPYSFPFATFYDPTDPFNVKSRFHNPEEPDEYTYSFSNLKREL